MRYKQAMCGLIDGLKVERIKIYAHAGRQQNLLRSIWYKQPLLSGSRQATRQGDILNKDQPVRRRRHDKLVNDLKKQVCHQAKTEYTYDDEKHPTHTRTCRCSRCLRLCCHKNYLTRLLVSAL